MKKEYKEAEICLIEVKKTEIVCDSGDDTSNPWEGPIAPTNL